MNKLVPLVACLGAATAAIIPSSGSADPGDWLSSDWSRRICLTADPSAIEGSESFVDFTLLLSMDATHFAPVFLTADPIGSDLVVTAGDGTTVLSHELVCYDPTAQFGELWFRAASFSDTANVFYLYYDNDVETPEETSQRASLAGEAWTQRHLAVYHFAEDPSQGVLADWGPNANDAVAAVGPFPVGPGWQSSNLVDGQIGTAWEYDGVDLYTFTGSATSADSSFTISAWFANLAVSEKAAIAFQGPWAAMWELAFERNGSDPRSATQTHNGFFSWQPAVLDEDLHHYVWTVDAEADTAAFYFDGVERSSHVRYTHNANMGSIYTGESIFGRIGIAGPVFWNSSDLASGVVDEYRIVEGVRSPEWVLTEYRNMSDPMGFYTIGAEEVESGGPTTADAWDGRSPFVTMTASPNPFRSVTWIDVANTRSRVATSVYDAKGRLVRTLSQPEPLGSTGLRYMWDGRDAQGSRVSKGIYHIRAQYGSSTVSTKVTVVR